MRRASARAASSPDGLWHRRGLRGELELGQHDARVLAQTSDGNFLARREGEPRLVGGCRALQPDDLDGPREHVRILRNRDDARKARSDRKRVTYAKIYTGTGTSSRRN